MRGTSKKLPVQMYPTIPCFCHQPNKLHFRIITLKTNKAQSENVPEHCTIRECSRTLYNINIPGKISAGVTCVDTTHLEWRFQEFVEIKTDFFQKPVGFYSPIV